MKKTVKNLRILLAGILIVLMLGGCASGNGTGSTVPESSAQSESSPAQSESSQEQSSSAPDSSAQSGEEESSSSASEAQSEPEPSGSEESSETLPPDLYGWIPTGRFQNETDPENDNYQALWEANLSRSDETLYFRLSEDPDAKFRSVCFVASVSLSDLTQGEPIAFSSDNDTVSVELFDDGSFEMLYNDEPEDWRSGKYLPIEPESPSYPRPQPEHDPKSPGGEMDAGLAEMARITLGLKLSDELTAEDCEKITVLNVFPEHFRLGTLDGIEYFPHLREIHVAESCVSDLAPLANLPELETIEFSNGVIESISVLKDCKNLKSVSFYSEPIRSIEALAELPRLEELTLIDTLITSVAPLRENHTIRRFSIDSYCVGDWETIADNEDLKSALVYDYEEYLAIETRAKEILNETVTAEMSDLEKEVRLAKAVEDRITYEYINENDYIDEGGKGHPFLYYPILQGIGVCRDYTDTAKYLMNLAGLEVRGCTSFDHAWNIICIDGKWYEFDCTWDDQEDAENWDWFNKSRGYMLIANDHDLFCPEMYPAAREDMPYAVYAPYVQLLSVEAAD